MNRHRQVIWKEGMFISPQHFQQQERYFRHYVEQYVASAGSGHRYGLSTLEIDRQRLKLGKVSVILCQGIFPDGTYFSCEQELLLEIPQATLGKTVYLALPMAVEGETEYGVRTDNRRYVQDTVTLWDTSSTGNHSVDTPVAQANVRLILEGEDISGLTLIPIARVLERRPSGSVVLEHDFIPACLQYGASTLLSDRLRELQIQLETRAQVVSQRIKAGYGHKSDQSLLREYLWLQTLNRWIPWMSVTLETPATPADEIYLQLATLSAELDSFSPVVAGSLVPLTYDQLHVAFNPLFSRLREQLSLVQGDNVQEFAWDTGLFDKRRLLRAAIPQIATLENHRFVLSVESSIGAAALAQLLPQACKLSGLSRIAELVHNGVSGIRMTVLPVAPGELKSRPDLTYIEIDTHHPLWLEMVENREPLALHVDGRIPDLTLKLYALG